MSQRERDERLEQVKAETAGPRRRGRGGGASGVPVETTNLDGITDQDIRFWNEEVEMMRITPDAFYILGQRVPLSEELEPVNKVYQALAGWLRSVGCLR